MSNATTTLSVVTDDGGQEAVFITLPAGTWVKSTTEQRKFEVTGPRPIVNFPALVNVGSFATWRAKKEAEGFTFRQVFT